MHVIMLNVAHVDSFQKRTLDAPNLITHPRVCDHFIDYRKMENSASSHSWLARQKMWEGVLMSGEFVCHFKNIVCSRLALFLITIFFLSSVEAYASVRVRCYESGFSGKTIAYFHYDAKCPFCFKVEELERDMEAFSSDNLIKNCPNFYFDYILEGTINYADPYLIAFFLFHYRDGRVFTLRIDSEGGYFIPALEIGEMLFTGRAEVYVSGRCYSACVLVVAGAVRRTYLSEDAVGVHRLSLENLPPGIPGDVKSINSYFERSYSHIESYFRKLNVSSLIMQRMKSTPSSSMSILSRKDLFDMGLSYNNVSHVELSGHMIKEKCGENKLNEYMRYINVSEHCFLDLQDSCRSSKEFWDTKLAIKHIEKQCLLPEQRYQIFNDRPYPFP